MREERSPSSRTSEASEGKSDVPATAPQQAPPHPARTDSSPPASTTPTPTRRSQPPDGPIRLRSASLQTLAPASPSRRSAPLAPSARSRAPAPHPPAAPGRRQAAASDASDEPARPAAAPPS